VRVVQLAGALADPEEVGPQVVVAALFGDEAGEGRLEGQVQGFVAGEQLAGPQVLGQPPQPLHEGQGVPHLVQGLQVVPSILPAPGEVPVLRVLQVCEPAVHQSPQVVEGGGGPVVGLHEPPGIRLPLVQAQALEEGPPVGRHLRPVYPVP